MSADLLPGEDIPHPLISSGTLSKREMGVSARQHVKTLTRPIFEAALHKKQKNTLPESYEYPAIGFRILWRPNNYRRKIMLPRGMDTGSEKALLQYPKAYISQKKVLYVPDYPGLMLIVGRRTITGVWSQPVVGNVKKTFLLARPTLGEIDELVEFKKQEIANRIDAAILHFGSAMGLSISGSLIAWERSENWFRGEEFVDKLPRGAIFYDETVKKVYDEGLEFVSGSGKKNSVASMLDYFHNQQVQRVAPELSVRLSNVEKVQIQLLEELRGLKRELVKPRKHERHVPKEQGNLSRWSDG